MVSENAKKFCCEDISLIENYDKAVADPTQIWVTHHRAEILPCGNYTVDDLKQFNLYYNRPASELIFLSQSEHMRLHKFGKHPNKWCWCKGKKMSDEFRKNCSNGMKRYFASIGGKLSDEHKRKDSEALTGLWYWTDGKINIRARECPGQGFHRGMAGHFYTNGVENRKFIDGEQPQGWVRGLTRGK